MDLQLSDLACGCRECRLPTSDQQTRIESRCSEGGRSEELNNKWQQEEPATTTTWVSRLFRLLIDRYDGGRSPLAVSLPVFLGVKLNMARPQESDWLAIWLGVALLIPCLDVNCQGRAPSPYVECKYSCLHASEIMFSSSGVELSWSNTAPHVVARKGTDNG